MNMRISILPKSALGWWSIGLVLASFVVGFASEDIISPAGIPNYTMALRAGLTFVPGVIAGAGFVTGLISITKKKQGAILVFASAAGGLVVMIEFVVAAVQTIMGVS
jgi:hypothetical protein